MKSKISNANSVSILTALLVSLLCLLGGSLMIGALEWQVSILGILIFTVFACGVTYLVSLYLVKQLILNRLGVLYKIIRSTRLEHPQELTENTTNQLLDSALEKVQDWSVKRLSVREKQEILKKYRQEFTGNISHELKTPLFSIEGYIHTLLDGAMHNPTLTKKYLIKTAENIDRLSEILNALSTISQFESGQLDLKIQEFDLRQLVLESVEEIRFLKEEKKSNIEIDGDEFTKFLVFADPQYIRQVFINLISNSFRYGKKKGKTKIEFSDLGDQYLIEVIDNGIGIEEEHIPHLFDRFYRVDAGRSRNEGGSGVGLAIVKHIINAHGQQVQVASKFGEGSNFSFTLRKA